ncbi:acetyl/propionyl/methylcrotonyl-CoA carboxylase subunit alpha [Ferrimonas balearica]|uniref:acetyl/propionyl/methylcrotonyl-CoA carboxylase subunit alpha n=1 Tax=Ferrimonas balearica TaxID=44012 RepID=UPI001C9A0ACE|nr:acetyl/propionyl/methylcrotonyl-CoA carboxylase subunit alpha [Ferrimonas balearica]MBY5990693.1 acetyl/propionyl/methylcrotonyl-CoA carboxylase subunit alpha [Ferrimonas balearica]
MNINKVLIANRGEIACRVIDTCRRLGVATVAVYSDADRHARHVAMADEAFRLGPAEARLSYLDAELLLKVARESHCDAVHPGYGFLSENPEFAEACEQAGIHFIGPKADAIAKMGSKSAAKAIMATAGVPMLPGYHGDEQSDERLTEEAEKIGYPLLVKAAFGGGGKGMRIVERSEELAAALATARREAQSAFGNDQLLLERYLTAPRHVEVQVFADSHGNAVYLSDRDCSIQRRHQKVVEEAPAPGLSDALRAEMGEASVRAAKAIDYLGAGTVEYLVDDQGHFYFMEMNTRLQVEHPVTELVTGQDLVAWQLKVAAGEPLPLTQEQIAIRGHAVEVRLYAEDPQRDFLPATGTLARLRWPEGDGVRVDTGVVEGDAITAYYDPMIAKLICFGDDRRMAIRRLVQALAQSELAGITTNLPFLHRIADHPAFAEAELHTGFIEQHSDALLAPSHDAWPAAWAVALSLLAESDSGAAPTGWRLNAPARAQLLLEDEHGEHYPMVLTASEHGWQTELNGITAQVALVNSADRMRLELNGHLKSWPCHRDETGVTVLLPGGPLRFSQVSHQGEQSAGDADKALQAPMNGTLVTNLVAVGDKVSSGQALVVMEAMKMEYTISAPFNGIVTALPFAEGDQVSDGTALVALDGEAEA